MSQMDPLFVGPSVKKAIDAFIARGVLQACNGSGPGVSRSSSPYGNFEEAGQSYLLVNDANRHG